MKNMNIKLQKTYKDLFYRNIVTARVYHIYESDLNPNLWKKFNLFDVLFRNNPVVPSK